MLKALQPTAKCAGVVLLEIPEFAGVYAAISKYKIHESQPHCTFQKLCGKIVS
jgi:hypothetical protein